MIFKNLLSSLIPTFSNTRRVAPTKTVGASGTAIYGGYIQENEKNTKLTGTEKYKTYSDILANTAIVAAGVRFFLNLIQKAEWSFNPADKTPRAMELAELMEEIAHDMETPWSRAMRRAAMYKFYGFSIQEWTAKKRDDGVMGLMDIAPRAQLTIERWDVDETGRVKGCVQRSPQTSEEIYLPRPKLLYLVDDSLNDSPEGLGIFRNMVESVNRLQRYEQLEGFGYESDLRGVPVGRAPYAAIKVLQEAGTLSPEEAAAATRVLEDFIKKHLKNPGLGIVLDSAVYEGQDDASTPSSQQQWGIDLLKGSSAGLGDANTAIERVNHEIARLLGVEHLLLGQTRGTQALSEDKSFNFGLIVSSTLGELSESVNRDVVRSIAEINGWPRELWPKAQTEEIQFKSPKEITEALYDLARSMLDPEDPAINVIRRQLGLPDALVINDQIDAGLATNRQDEPPNNENEDVEDDVSELEEESEED